MKHYAFGFAGRIGSGKTSISSLFAERLGLSRVSFGDYVRAAAARIGYENADREFLQELGALCARDPRVLCAEVLKQVQYVAGGSVVIDGIRHRGVIDALRGLVAPADFVLIYVEATEDTLLRRNSARRQATAEHMHTHSTEIQVVTEAFIGSAAVRVTNDAMPPSHTVDVICDQLREQGISMDRHS